MTVTCHQSGHTASAIIIRQHITHPYKKYCPSTKNISTFRSQRASTPPISRRLPHPPSKSHFKLRRSSALPSPYLRSPGRRESSTFPSPPRSSSETPSASTKTASHPSVSPNLAFHIFALFIHPPEPIFPFGVPHNSIRLVRLFYRSFYPHHSTHSIIRLFVLLSHPTRNTLNFKRY